MFLSSAASWAAEPSEAGLPQFDISTFPSQLFWLAVSFVFLYVFFSKKILPDLSSTIENRRSQVDSDYETAKKFKEEAESVQAKYEQNLEQAKADAAKAFAMVQDKMKQKAEKQAADFRKNVESDTLALEKSITKAKAEAMQSMNMIAAEVAAEATHKIVGIATDVKYVEALLQDINKKEAA